MFNLFTRHKIGKNFRIILCYSFHEQKFNLKNLNKIVRYIERMENISMSNFNSNTFNPSYMKCIDNIKHIVLYLTSAFFLFFFIKHFIGSFKKQILLFIFTIFTFSCSYCEKKSNNKTKNIITWSISMLYQKVDVVYKTHFVLVLNTYHTIEWIL